MHEQSMKMHVMEARDNARNGQWDINGLRPADTLIEQRCTRLNCVAHDMPQNITFDKDNTM